MSLINQMFKDLEKRRSSLQAGIKKTAPYFMHAQARLVRYKFWIYILIVSSFLFFIFDFFVIFDHLVNKKTIKATANPDVVAASMLPRKAENQPALETVLLKSVAMDMHDGRGQLRFLLSSPVLYRISVQSNGRAYSIILDNTRALADLPVLNYESAGIYGLGMSAQPDGSLLIKFQLKKDALVKQAGIFKDAAEFVVNVKFNQPTELPQSVEKPRVVSVRSESQQQNDFATQSTATALKLSARGENNKAISLLKSVLDISPDWHPARESLAQMLMQQGRTTEAEIVLQAGLDQFPKWLPYIELQARCLALQGREKAALHLMSRHSPSLDKHPDYYAFMAALYQRQHQSLMAATLYRQLISSRPEVARWWLGYAIALDSLDRHAEAVSAYNQTLSAQVDPLTPALKAWVETRLRSSD